jgi:perosamine synthetase
LPEHLTRTRVNFAALGAALADIPGLDTHAPRPDAEPSATFRFITFASEAQCRAVLDALWPSPLGVSRLFARVIGDYPHIAAMLEASATPNARDLAARTLTISTSSLLTDADRAAIVTAIRNALPHDT